MYKSIFLLFASFFLVSCAEFSFSKKIERPEMPFVWEGANTYFLLTDRFNNGDPSNDVNFNRNQPTGPFRGFQGGDFKGITHKIKSGYFSELGINVLWFSPVFEQGHGVTNEGTGPTYGYHGYWIKDWTAFDPNWGTEADFAELVETAHKNGIRILLDVVMNHTTPNTVEDPEWGPDWVRMQPPCLYDTYDHTVNCNLVDNLPDVKTEIKTDVELPAQLLEKWKKEGRLEKELAELDQFFAKTGYPKAPRYYIIKWLTDLVKQYGIDGYRIDTAKHTEADVWSDLWEVAHVAFNTWKNKNRDKVLDDNEFFMVGEVYNYHASGGRKFMNADKEVDYFAHHMNAMINFEFKSDALKDYDELFTKYSNILYGDLSGLSVMNYLTSHDDLSPFDKNRKKSMEAATKLLLSPGISQVYYGDESNRSLDYPEAIGDASLRSFMNWNDLKNNASVHGVKAQDLWLHYAKLGKFRRNNPAVGAGKHSMMSKNPYIFMRELNTPKVKNKVIVGMDLNKGKKVITVTGEFPNGTLLYDYYSDQEVMVRGGKVRINSDETFVLLGY